MYKVYIILPKLVSSISEIGVGQVQNKSWNKNKEYKTHFPILRGGPAQGKGAQEKVTIRFKKKEQKRF